MLRVLGGCRRHGDVLGDTVLQRDAAAGRERADGDDTAEERGRVHLLGGLGVPEEGLLRRARVRHAAGGPVPRAAQRSGGDAAELAGRRRLHGTAVFHCSGVACRITRNMGDVSTTTSSPGQKGHGREERVQNQADVVVLVPLAALQTASSMIGNWDLGKSDPDDE